MAIADLVRRGYAATIGKVATRGYGAGAPVQVEQVEQGYLAARYTGGEYACAATSDAAYEVAYTGATYDVRASDTAAYGVAYTGGGYRVR